MKKFLLSLAAACAFVHAYADCSLIEIPLQQRITAATFVAEGKVTAQQSYWDVTHTMIYTAHTIEVYKVFKGTGTPEYIQLLTQGGTVGDSRITVEPSLELEVGDMGVFTCEPVTRIAPVSPTRNALPQYEPYASAQGFVKYDLENNVANDVFATYTGIENTLYPALLPMGRNSYTEVKEFHVTDPQRGNQPNVSVTAISGFFPTTVTAGTGTVLTITGNAFGGNQGIAYISFKNADDGGATYIQPLQSQYLFWSNTLIMVQVPDNAGTGTIQFTRGNTQTSPGILTVTYAHQNVDFNPGTGITAYQTDHNNDNGSGGYTWQLNAAFDADVWAKAAFSRAFNTWRCNTNINWITGSTTAVNTAISDGVNVVTYDNAAPLPAGVKATCVSYYTSCNSIPGIVWTVNEMDLVFDEGSNIAPNTWQYGPAAPSASQFDFESAALHELGHGHQLAHTINSGAVMHFVLAAGVSRRTLDVTDLSGGNYVQNRSTAINLCGPSAMTNFGVCSPAPVAAFSGTPTTVCVGQSVTFTDQSANNPTSWVWQFAGGTPATSALQNPTVTYNTPGTYAVLLSASSSNGSNVNQVMSYITVNPIPTLTITSTPSNGIVCIGSQATLTASGATTYNWSGGITNGIPFSINTTTTYTVTGTSGGCQATDSITLTVAALPAVTATSNPPDNDVLCMGTYVTLNGAGAATYSWSGGVTDGNPFPILASETFTVTGTDTNGCQNTATITHTVIVCGPASVPCGGTYYNMLSQISATPLVGAVAYRFTFYDITTGAQVAQHTQASRTLTFGSVNGIYYNTIYRMTVAVDLGSGFSAESHPTCPIVFDVPHPVVPCGNSYQNLNSTVSASPTSRVTNFLFRFYDNVTGALVAQRSQPSNILVFGLVPGLYNNMTYRYTVTCEYPLLMGGTAFGPESSQSCPVTFGLPFTTVPCGNTYTVLNAVVTAPLSYGAANYHFTFYDNVTGLQVAQRIQPSNVLTLSNVSGIYYANTYRWTVQVEYNVSGGGTAFGPVSNSTCAITLGIPATVVPCNGVYNLASGFASATNKFGATGYRFRFYQSNVLMAQRTQVSRTLTFSTVPGLVNNQSYMWTVEVEYNNGTGIVYGPPSNPCSIGFGTPPPLAPPQHAPEQFSAEGTDGGEVLSLQLYPNPTRDLINIVTTEPVEAVYVYTITGTLVKSDSQVNQIGLAEFNPGTYVVVVKTASGVQRALVVKE